MKIEALKNELKELKQCDQSSNEDLLDDEEEWKDTMAMFERHDESMNI